MAAAVMLVLAKVATVYVPVIYGRIVDALAPKDGAAMLAVPLGLVVGYGLLRTHPRDLGSCVMRCSRPCSNARCVSRRCARSAICMR